VGGGALAPTPNPPTPNPQSPIPKLYVKKNFKEDINYKNEINK